MEQQQEPHDRRGPGSRLGVILPDDDMRGAARGPPPALTTLVSFDGPNGSLPTASLTFDLAGNLYGTTMFGGGASGIGQGTVFQLSGPNHAHFATLVRFNGRNGTNPAAGLALDEYDNLYGTTQTGGAAGTGTAFELSAPGHRAPATLASFVSADGTGPLGGLALYSPGQFHVQGHPFYAGNLYGTTSAGGANSDGTAFELSGPDHTVLTTLVSFSASVTGSRPGSTLVAGSRGDLFGTTFTGGAGGGYGTVFRLSGTGHQTLTTLATFNGPNGANPIGGLTLDAAGNLYGTTQYGGPGTGGTIFELAGPSHRRLVTLASFGTNDPNGAVPQGTLLIDAAGNLFGTTNGGADEFGGNGAFLGAVFRLSAGRKTLTPLHAFTGGLDGDIPQAGLVADAAGNLYGTTTSGGAGGDSGGGTVFELTGSGFVTSTASPSARR